MQDLTLNFANQGLETLQTDEDQPARILNLKGNKLQDFAFLRHFPRLIQLDLSECELDCTHNFFKHMPSSVRLLKLQRNNLADFNALDDFSNIRTLDISNNPF